MAPISDNHDDAPISFENKKAEREARKKAPSNKNPKLFNIPEVTKYLTGLLIFIYLVQIAGMMPADMAELYYNFGFVPAKFAGAFYFNDWSLMTPITYMFLHGSTLHIVINSMMLLAFGAGVERWLGGKRMLAIFFACGIIAALVHFVFSMGSVNPVIGASGATSGLFAAGIVMLRNMNVGVADGQFGFVPLIAVFIAISFIFSMTGSPDGSSVAWIAHIGGFLAGFGMLKLMKQM